MEEENNIEIEDYTIEESDGSSYSDDSYNGSSSDCSDSDGEIDYSSSSYNIATKPVTSAPDMVDADDAWVRVMEEENGHFEVDFDDSCSGPKHIGQSKKPFDFFNLLFTSYLWNMIVVNTNKYGNSEKINKWKDVNKKTMQAFMAIL